MYYDDMTDEERKLYQTPVTKLDVSIRVQKCARKLGIITIADLVRRTAEDFLECKNFGMASLNHLRDRLAARGLRLRGD